MPVAGVRRFKEVGEPRARTPKSPSWLEKATAPRAKVNHLAHGAWPEVGGRVGGRVDFVEFMSEREVFGHPQEGANARPTAT